MYQFIQFLDTYTSGLPDIPIFLGVPNERVLSSKAQDFSVAFLKPDSSNISEQTGNC